MSEHIIDFDSNSLYTTELFCRSITKYGITENVSPDFYGNPAAIFVLVLGAPPGSGARTTLCFNPGLTPSNIDQLLKRGAIDERDLCHLYQNRAFAAIGSPFVDYLLGAAPLSEQRNVEYACANPNVPTTVIRELLQSGMEINWHLLCGATADVSILEENLDKVEWDAVLSNPRFPIAFIESHIDRISPKDWVWACSNESAPLWFIEKYSDKLDRHAWSYVWARHDITTEFLTRFWDHINWNSISLRHPNFEFIAQHMDKVSWEHLSGNTSVPLGVFEQNLDKVSWKWLSGNTSIPESFFEQHAGLVDWENLCRNNAISPGFFARHFSELRPTILANNFEKWLGK